MTPDHVNPEAPWPHDRAIWRAAPRPRQCLTSASRSIQLMRPSRRVGWMPELRTGASRRDTDGFARGRSWAPGRGRRYATRRRLLSPRRRPSRHPRPRCIIRRAAAGQTPRRSRDRHACSRRAAESSTPSARPPTSCARASAATRSATSSTATSTTPTSAIYSCRFCAFSKGKLGDTCAARPTTSTATKSSAASAKRGSAARPKSACRAASIPRYTGDDLSRHSASRQARRSRHPRPCILAAGGAHGATSLGLTRRRLSRPAARRGPRQPAGHRGRNPR